MEREGKRTRRREAGVERKYALVSFANRPYAAVISD